LKIGVAKIHTFLTGKNKVTLNLKLLNLKIEKVLRDCGLPLWCNLGLRTSGLLSSGDIYTTINPGRSQISNKDLVNSVYCVRGYAICVIVYKNVIIIIIIIIIISAYGM